MRLILSDPPEDIRANFYPLAFSRPLWELRCGFGSLAEKLVAKVGAADVACFAAEYMADAYREKTSWRVNDPAALSGDDLLIVDPRVRAAALDVPATGPSEVGLDADGSVLYARIARGDADRLAAGAGGAAELLAAAKEKLPTVPAELPTWRYVWDLILANAGQLVADFESAGRSGLEGTVEQPVAVRGREKDVYIAPRAEVHPMVVLDAADGPIYVDEGAEIHPFTRIEGPCYIGPNTTLLGAKCRAGCSIGPVCRVGGEVEESILHGYTNKYHDGFVGHAYVGEWVNLGALTTNSDLKNDYSTVSVTIEGRPPLDTGSTKVGSLIGDHVKTSIGTLLNTGSYVGAMALVVATGKPLPKTIPSFAWFLEGVVTKGFGKRKLYETAKVAMSRRDGEWTAAEQALWDAVFERTAPARREAVKRGRKAMSRS
jgi:UDP-N-acetylglucosamine diphosphorylase/glucosamine-1-phosphate N-acetyltransferase